MSPPTSKESGTARIVGSASAGVLELLVFHPVDTVAKRLMTNSTKIQGSGDLANEAASKGTLSRYLSLFPGLGAAAGYKFGGQPFVNDYFNKNHSESFKAMIGDRHAKAVMYATAGSIIGIGEVVLLPLDALKIKLQTNAAEYGGRSIVDIIKTEGFGLYRGAGWTIARNAPGSFALFGGSAFMKEYILGLEDYSKATFLDNFAASIAGAVASITISAPFDVIKTRIQSKLSTNAESGLTIVRNMLFKEGIGSFFKGLTPKLLVVGPKLVFSFTIAQQMIPLFDKVLKQTQASTILGKKAANDLARANKLSKLSKQITAAVRAGNYETDPKHNLYLSSALNIAKTHQVPKSVIQDAIQRAVTKNQGFQLNTYQGLQGNIAFIVEASTGNLKKTSSELKFIFKDSGGSMSPVDYLFEHICFITVAKDSTFEELELFAIELNALDVQKVEDSYLLKCHVKDMQVIKLALEKRYKLLEIKIVYHSTEKLLPDNMSNFTAILSRLQNQDEVTNVYHNAQLSSDADS